MTRALVAQSDYRSGWLLMLVLLGFATAIGFGATALSLAMSSDRPPSHPPVTSRRE